MLRKILMFWKVFLFVFVMLGLVGCSSEAVSVKNEKQLSNDLERVEKVESSSPGEVSWGNAPDFTLSQLNRESFTLSSLKGKVIILDFWATWCPPCRKGIPDFIALREKYKEQGLEVVGVLLDQGKRASLESKIEEMGINYVVVLGGREVTQAYGGVRAIPTTFIIDQNGNKVEKYVGLNPKETFENKIKELFAQEVKE
ncbi:redoxin domain-containing protein [bacterium]|nr:redoxin domain-containing protein [bacterium]